VQKFILSCCTDVTPNLCHRWCVRRAYFSRRLSLGGRPQPQTLFSDFLYSVRFFMLTPLLARPLPTYIIHWAGRSLFEFLPKPDRLKRSASFPPNVFAGLCLAW
jgi:hypothetical protein